MDIGNHSFTMVLKKKKTLFKIKAGIVIISGRKDIKIPLVES